MRFLAAKNKGLIGVGIVVILLIGWIMFPFAPHEQTEEPPQTDDPFVLGEYYFNADDEPGGAYDLEKARYFYEQAIMASSTAYEAAWYQLGRIDFIQGRFDAALYKFEKQIEEFGDSVPQVYYMTGLTYGYKARETNDSRDWEQGAEAFKTFITYDPRAPWPRVDLAWIYFSQGKYEVMIPLLEEGLEYEPENAWLLNMYGLALLNTGERETAEQMFIHADQVASTLTTEDWGKTYPGNNPADWEQGLREFRAAIKANLKLSQN